MGAFGCIMLACSCALAVACGFSMWRAWEAHSRSRRHKASIAGVEASSSAPASLPDRIIDYMEALSRNLSQPGSRKSASGKDWAREPKGLASMLRLAGLEGKVTGRGFAEARLRLTVAGAALGCAFGAILSLEMAFVLALVGAACGFMAPSYVLRTQVKLRAKEAERHLPEMLDVVALGMRSGLSFDSSLRIYASHFDTRLSRELESARVQWSSGLTRRDEALRSLASTYDSVVFGHVIETVVKSIRYGSSMVSSLESDAAEARSVYQTEREERIAKAPVKMMVPTGVLILPAMLIMVLGPVLLELVQGGL